jgi:hypothetical protein
MGKGEKKRKDQADGEGSQDPRTGYLGGVSEDDTPDEEGKKDGKRTPDHTFSLPWAAGFVRNSLIAHLQ